MGTLVTTVIGLVLATIFIGAILLIVALWQLHTFTEDIDTLEKRLTDWEEY
jgi:hypothetical protein